MGLSNTLAATETDVEQTREELFRRIGKGASDALDDDYVHDKLKELRMLWQNWVSENAISSVDTIPQPLMEKLLETALPNTLSSAESQQLYHLFIKEQGAPRMLLGILVSHSVCETLFRDPFAFLEAAGKREQAVLQSILDHGMLSKQQRWETVIK